MGRGVSSGGGQSSLGYLFGSGEAPTPAGEKSQAAGSVSRGVSKEPSAKPNGTPQPVDVSKQVPAGIHSSTTSNIFRADGQSTCNFITVHFQSNNFFSALARTYKIISTNMYYPCSCELTNGKE
ncbi:UNVERIFIED_CONTAM: protein SPIRAL1-like 1 [Sesamum latifolium]|uniref:Protein SPIRAL1-like 1 n=1 Tax=Sesamum latifolium TaxID=2727402 RepID=A0AAW2UUD2_9LAMI